MSTGTIDISENFELAFRFATETNENIFLTGKAGTGKTTFLKYLKDHTCKNMMVAAPTGVAAINAGGVTLHSLFQLPFRPFLPTPAGKNELLSTMRINSRRQQLLRKLDLLVIDEVSMVRCDTMDAIDTILRSVRRKPEDPFGGVQVLFIGDLFQLPPVAPRHEWMILQEYYASEFFFDSHVIRQQMPMLIELTKIFRQREDSFIRLLNKVRNNNMEADDFEDLHHRYFPDFRPSFEEKYITLTSHNNQADRINHSELSKLLPASFTYHASIIDDFPESMYPAEGELILKEGAQVMFLKNDPEKRFFNGKIGVVSSLDDDEIVVNCDGMDIYVEQETWENSRYTVDKNDGSLAQEVLGTFTQYPLRLAWAITIHKSQGLTFENVIIDAGAAFSSGQVYVALSRCTNLDGIVLTSKIPPTAIYSNETVVRCHQSLIPKGSLAERFEGARQVYTQQLLEETFEFKEIQVLLDVLHYKIHDQREKLNPEAAEWITGLRDELNADRAVGIKFVNLTGNYFKQEKIIEKNTDLQKRVMDAANHFSPKLHDYIDRLTHHPIITEHRETSTAINDILNQVFLAFYIANYNLEYCKRPFSVTDFLRHKLKFVQPKINLSIYASNKKQAASVDLENAELFNTLKRWRDMTCVETGMPIYMVANQQSLNEIATYLPATIKELMKIKGFGKAKAEKYGDELLEIVKDYCERVGVESNMDALNTSGDKKSKSQDPKPKTKVPTYKISLELYRSGKSIDEIASERNYARTTIEGHLSQAIEGGELNVDDFVSEEKKNCIKEAAAKHGVERLKDLKDQLPEEISFGEIRMVLADMKRSENVEKD